MLAEAKANTIHLAARIAEYIGCPTPLELRDGASLDSAKQEDVNAGNYRESANHYYTVLLRTEFEGAKAEALIGLVQQLINLGDLGSARKLLSAQESEIANRLSPVERNFFLAEAEGKIGWIDEYELGFFQSRDHFSKAAGRLIDIPENQWSEREWNLFSTTRHFLGRASLALACLGVDKEVNASRAIDYFGWAMDLDKQGDEPDKYGKIGFGNAWIARCYMVVGHYRTAYHYINEADINFNKQMDITRKMGYKAHSDLMYGMHRLAMGDTNDARRYFMDAVRIRTSDSPEGEHYPKGLADAYLGLVKTDWMEHKYMDAVGHLVSAVKAHPYSALRGAVVGA